MQAELINKQTAAISTQVLALRSANKATIALSAAKFTLTGHLKAAGMAAKMFFKSIKTGLGPIGWATLAIEGLLAALVPLMKKFKDQREFSKKLEQANKDLASTYADVVVQIEQEKKKLDELSSAALNAKKGTKNRADAIDRINKEYKQYLPSLLTEKSSNEDIALAMQAVNTQLEQNIKLKAKQSSLTEIQKNIDSQTKDTMTAVVEHIEKKSKKELSSDSRKEIYQAVNAYKEALSDNTATDEHRRSLALEIGELYKQQAGFRSSAQMDRLYNLLAPLDKVIVSSRKAKEQLDALYGADIAHSDSNNDYSGINGNHPDFTVTSEEVPTEDKSDKIHELERLIEESKRVIQSGIDDARVIENQRYQEELDKFRSNKKALIAAGVDYEALMQTIENKHQTKLSQINLQQLENKKKLLAQEHELEVAQMQNRHNVEIDAAVRAGEDLTELKARQSEELQEIDTKYALALQDILDEVINIDGTINLDITGLSIEEVNALKIKLEELKAVRDKLVGTGDMTTTGETDMSSETQSPSKPMGGSMLDLNADEWSKLFDSGTSGWEKMGLAARAFGDVANQSMKIVSMAIRRQEQQEKKLLAQYRKSNDQKKAALEDRLNSGLITESQYNASVKAMDADYEAYQEELALKQAKREKAMSLTQAIINVAMGVTNALGSMPPPFNFINAGLVSAMGATEIALIASTPITTGAEEGGDIFVRREQDGKVFPARLSPDKRGFISSPTVLVGEAGPEYVIPAEGVANPSIIPFLGTIEQARRAGTLRNLNLGAVYSPATVSAFASGGTTKPTTINNISSTSTVYNDVEVKKLLQEIILKLDKPVPAVVSMLGPKGIVKAQEDYNRLKKHGRL